MKSAIIAASIALAAATGCSTLPRNSDLRTAATASASESESTGYAIASGPALVHLSSGGDGRFALYLADDPGVGSAACPSAASENAVAFAVVGDDSHLSDLPVPGGKRICAAPIGDGTLSIDWLSEDYGRPAPTRAPSGALVLARR
jgi:hypothetical protein